MPCSLSGTNQNRQGSSGSETKVSPPVPAEEKLMLPVAGISAVAEGLMLSMSTRISVAALFLALAETLKVPEPDTTQSTVAPSSPSVITLVLEAAVTSPRVAECPDVLQDAPGLAKFTE